MADIVRSIPWQLSDFGTGVTGGNYSLQDYRFDYALGGIPFLSATRDAWPYTEGMAEIRKQQFDSFAEPGEQSISGNFWWLRSQSNFSGGAGVLYQDPDNDNQFNIRFADSLGVDPWTSGQLQLLKQPTLKYTIAGVFNRVRGYVDSTGVDACWYCDGSQIYKVTDASRTSIVNPSIGVSLDFASTGTRNFFMANDGIFSGVDAGALAKIWDAPSPTPTSGAIEWAKSRIVACFDNKVYFLGISGGTALPATPNYTHPDSSWKWTSITEGPTAIYIAGRNSTQSSIYKVTIELNGATETYIPTVTATLPSGEWVNTIYSYVGSFIGIATNKGFRVGEFDSNGDIIYGPLLFSPAGGCAGITGFDRFMYVGSVGAHDGFSGTFRVDLGQTIQEQTTRAVRYAYARDIYAPGETASVFNVTTLGASGRLVFAVSGDSLWVQSATDLYSEGYLKTGRIRFNTEEPKLYKFISLRTPLPLQGNLEASVLGQGGEEIPVITYGPEFGPGTGDVATPSPTGPQNWIGLKFTLSRNASDLTKGAVLNGWQVKALPGSIRQRVITHTFQLFNEEEDKGGQRIGYDEYARQRFEAFKQLARAGDVVVFQELIEDLSTLVVIEDWKFVQTSPPGNNQNTLGGYLTVQMRTVAESV